MRRGLLEGQSSQPPVAIAGPCHSVVGWLLHSSDAAEASANLAVLQSLGLLCDLLADAVIGLLHLQ